MKRLFKLLLLILVVMSCVTPVYGADTYIRNLIITCKINENGSADFTETWDMYAYAGTEGYKIFDNMAGQPVTLKSVTDEKGKPFEKLKNWDIDRSLKQKAQTCGVIYDADENHYELCFGLGSYGHHQYTLNYHIDHFVNQYANVQGINYAFISDMELTVENAEIELYDENHQFTFENSAIWGFGYYGSCDFDTKGHIHLVNESSLEGDRMQLLMRLDEGKYTEPNKIHKEETFEAVLDDARIGSAYEEGYDDDIEGDADINYDKADIWSMLYWVIRLVALFFFGMIVIIEVFVKGLFSKGSSKPNKGLTFENENVTFNKKDVHPFRDIPCDKNLLYFYYFAKKIHMINTDNRSGIMAAFLLRWINRGYTSFVRGEKKGLLFKHDTYAIDLTGGIPVHSDPESKLLSMYRRASGKNMILETKEFEKWCRKYYDTVENWFTSLDTYVEDELKSRGIIRTETTYRKFLGLEFPKTKLIYSMKAYEYMEQTAGFYKFLVDQDNLKDKEVIEVQLWDDYLVFATVLGIAEQVIKQLDIVCPQYQDYHSNYTYADYMLMHSITRSFVNDGSRAAHSAYTSANSGSSYSGGGGGSSFSGGGGGFSGGGGGGVR
ncbi:MAG: DUF2207 domain-containing protein [Erysipelotrichaceae bacterium]|nr:DUF2207 domain-containing protein [Erysipelotrichaceae bacterium]